jgi:hypothetical protein
MSTVRSCKDLQMVSIIIIYSNTLYFVRVQLDHVKAYEWLVTKYNVLLYIVMILTIHSTLHDLTVLLQNIMCYCI